MPSWEILPALWCGKNPERSGSRDQLTFVYLVLTSVFPMDMCLLLAPAQKHRPPVRLKDCFSVDLGLRTLAQASDLHYEKPGDLISGRTPNGKHQKLLPAKLSTKAIY